MSHETPMKKSDKQDFLYRTGTMVAVLFIGIILAVWTGYRTDREMRKAMLYQSQLVAEAINIERVKVLSGSETDIAVPAYQRIKEQLSAVRHGIKKCRFVYLLGRTDKGKLFIFVDSEPHDSVDYSPPGDLYNEAPKGFHNVFITDMQAVEGPYTDRWGTWITSLVPEHDPHTGTLVATLCMDVAAKTWIWDAARSGLPVMLFTLALIVILSAFKSLLKYRARTEGDPPSWIHHLEPILAVITGLTLTFFGAWTANERENYARYETFALVATGRTAVVAEKFRDIRDIELEGLSSFFENSQEVTAEEFRHYSTYLTRDPAIKLWGWIPAVAASDKTRFEKYARSSWDKNFRIWQKDSNGKPIPAMERDWYFPVLSEVSLPGNEKSLGFDLASESKNSSAIEEAIRTGLPTATDPFTIVKNSVNHKTILVFRPVFHRNQPKIVKGLALAVLNLTVLMEEAERDTSTHLELNLIEKDGRTQKLTTSCDADKPLFRDLQQTRPVLVFGKSFSVTAHAGNGFMKLNPNKAIWIVSLTGILLTTAITIVLATILRRREELERLVAERTSSLCESEAKLRESSERLMKVLNNIDALVYLSDFHTYELLFVNDYGLKVWGDTTGKTCFQALQALDSPCSFCKNMHLLDADGNPTGVFNWEYQNKVNGRWYDIRDYAIQWTDGRLVKMQIASDITERKQAENELKRSREQFELAVQGSNDGIWDWDLRDNSLFLSPRWKEQLGYRDDELPSHFDSFKNNLHPEDHDRVMASINEYLSGHESQYEMEFRLKHKDGFWRWIISRGVAVRGTDGKPVRMAGSNTDITERKMIERQMAALSAVVEHSDNIIVVKDLDLRVIAANNTFAKVAGLSSVSELIGKTDAEIFNVSPDTEPVKSYMQDERDAQKLSRGEFIHREEPVMTAEGRVRTVLTKKYPIFNKSNTLIATGNISIDITDGKHVERDLLQTNQQLEEAIARANEMAIKAEMASIAKSEFLANMSHEIRTPMNGVIGMTGLLLDTELNDEQRRYSRAISTSGEALLSLINDILDFSKIEAGKLDLETLDFDLSLLLEDFSAALAVRANEKGIKLLCSAEPDVPVLLQGDPGRLRQILTNLTGNAVKFTSSGEVEIRVKTADCPLTDSDSIVLRFSVRDTGIGIAKDKIGLLFNKFTQADASTTREYGGTGLGLAISKQLAELMGGEIGVISEEGKGSEFWFTARFDKQSEKTRIEAKIMEDFNDIRVLIVDDNETNRQILVTRLASWGMRTVEAEDSPSALHAIYRSLSEKDFFRLAVINMQMPGMNGKSLGRAIKADPEIAGIHLVMLTSMGTRGDARHFAEIGFSGYLTKPVHHQELRGVLSLILTVSLKKEMAHRPIATRHTAREIFPRYDGRHTRILLAEDNITNQQVAMGLLGKLGFKADVVSDGQDVLDALESTSYDLVLMDCQMPVLDGFETTRRLRAKGFGFKDLPIIALTAHAMKGDRKKCLDAGMNDHIAKPISAQELVAILVKWLPDLTQDNENNRLRNKKKDGAVSTMNEDSSMIWNHSAMLERLNGDEKLAGKIIEGFLMDIPKQIQTLRTKLEAGDIAAAERQAHTIRGAAAVVGGEALLAVAYEMEQAAASGALNHAKGSMERLKLAFERLKHAIEIGGSLH